MAPPRLVVITPVFQEEAGLAEYERAVREVLLSRADLDVQLVLVDDGSTDRSWELIVDLCRREPRARGLRLSRNFGAHLALMAGFAVAEGDMVATLACDLQDPPETVLDMVERWRAGARVVWARRRTREDGAWRRLTSAVFARLLRRHAFPRGSQFQTGSFLLLDRRVVEGLRRFEEHRPITFALVAWTGFDQAVVDYDRRQRRTGKSGWTLSRMLRAMYDAFIGFSLVPVHLVTVTGVLMFLLGAGLGLYALVSALTGRPVAGWTSLTLVLSCFFGVQFLVLGVLAEYLARIYAEVMRRPRWLVAADTAEQRGGA